MQELYIETPRLIIRSSDKTAEEYVIEHSGEETSIEDFMAKLPENIYASIIKDTGALLELAELLAANHDENRLIFSARALNDDIIGYMAINHIGSATPSVSVSVIEREHRKGYAYEMLAALLAWMGRNYPDKTMYYYVRPDNAASIALAKKLGGRLVQPKSLVEEVILQTYVIEVNSVTQEFNIGRAKSADSSKLS